MLQIAANKRAWFQALPEGPPVLDGAAVHERAAVLERAAALERAVVHERARVHPRALLKGAVTLAHKRSAVHESLPLFARHKQPQTNKSVHAA